uniref:NAD(P)-binding domain-containing protein n=1 Tax=Rhodosorus marinus TaxID=101924 RepID=A0A7S3EE11_9RHOD|mmetsp:Transcript_26417/g.102950  ORF Transcript_26417/g.102950 Transcript_26417/m.102950 type:complete len:347 (+) Transcript_26417:401-1441(+)
MDEYRPRNILLTGGAGFIGSHVTVKLVEKYPDYRVIVLDKGDYCSAEENLKSVLQNERFKFVHGDIRSKSLLDYLLREEQINTIMHFAASTHVDNSFGTSIGFTVNNVVGTHVLLEAAREYGKLERFIHVSTDEVYGGETQLLQTEESLLAPTNPYACTKAAAEYICRAYLMSFNLPIVMTRGNNVYGPHQYPDKLIPKSICLLQEGKSAFVHGDGTPTRNYVFVDDCVNAFDIILHKGSPGGVYNIGSDQEKSNLQVVKDIIQFMNLKADRVEHVEDRAFNDERYRIDSTKLLDLGWRQKVGWERGLQLTIDWYGNRQNLERWPSWRNGLVPHPQLGVPAQQELI